MTKAKREYTNGQINRAGETLINSSAPPDDIKSAREVLKYWRMQHVFPLNIMQTALRRAARSINPEATVSQRLKREKSVVDKLDRFKTMELSRMGDIAGCRAILDSVDEVYEVLDRLNKGKIGSQIIDTKDYIANPKPSGYRGIHLLVKYEGRREEFNGNRVEMQIRTSLQHSWATAVEIVDIFNNDRIKVGQGDAEWEEFFALAGKAFEEKELNERSLSSDIESFARFAELYRNLEVRKILSAYNRVIKMSVERETSGSHQPYFLIDLDPREGVMEILEFNRNEDEEANREYTRRESEAENNSRMVSLVAAKHLEGLRRAYPSYFSDSEKFLDTIDDYIRWTGFAAILEAIWSSKAQS